MAERNGDGLGGLEQADIQAVSSAPLVETRGPRGAGVRRDRVPVLATIRGRLLVSYVLIGVVPVLLIALIGLLFSWRSGWRRVHEQVGLLGSIVGGDLAQRAEDLHLDLAAALAEGEVGVSSQILLQSRSWDPDTEDVYASLRINLVYLLGSLVEDSELFDALFLVSPEGSVVLSTDPDLLGKQFSGQRFASDGLTGFAVQAGVRSATGEPMLSAAALPVSNVAGDPVGVFAGRIDKSIFDNAMAVAASEAGEAYLVGPDLLPLTDLRFGGHNVVVDTAGVRAALEEKGSGTAQYTNYIGAPVIGSYRWLPALDAVAVVEMDQAEAFGATSMMLIANSGFAVAVAVISVVVALTITRSIAGPMTALAGTAERIAGGDLDLAAPEAGVHEVRSLAQAFNSMTVQLRDLIGGLERSISQRTSDLERRSRYAEAAAGVGRAASTILDPERLFGTVVDQVQALLSLYYVGLFVIDEAQEWAVLRAGSGEAGRQMVDRGHRLRIGEGTVGWSIQHAQPRVAAEREDAGRVIPDELPDTRSEAALPLRSRGRVLGALTLQSEQSGAFDEGALVVLQMMADQVGTALDNARLFGDREAALAAARRASGDLSREAWTEVLRARSELGFRSDEYGVEPSRELWLPDMERAAREGRAVLGTQESDAERGQSLTIPIRLYGEVVGVLNTRKPDDTGAWTSEQVALVEQVVEELAQALENARLYEETQRRGIREQQLREIGTRMQSTVDLDAILRAAVEDLARALDVPSAFVQLYEGQTALSE